MISAVEFKKRVLGASILSIIMGKLCHKKKLYPIILFEIDKDLKIGFYCAVMSFDLVIYLKIEDIYYFTFKIKEIT